MSRNVFKGLRLKTKPGELNPARIEDAIEKALLAQRRPVQDWTQKKTFSPSSIGYGHARCARFWFLAFNGTDSWDDDVDTMGVANMGVGSMVHDYIQSAIKESGFLVAEELEVTLEDPPIRGFLDAIVDIDGEELVCEIKTTRQESFASKEFSRKPSPNHLIQILIYLLATGKKRGFLLYMNKNDQTMLVIPVELDETNKAIIDDVFDWLREVREAYEDDTLPLIPFTRGRNSGEPSNSICRSCPVQKDCFSKPKDGVVDIPIMKVPVL